MSTMLTLQGVPSGMMALVSPKQIPIDEILSSYYLRQSIEQIFGFSKSGRVPPPPNFILSIKLKSNNTVFF